MAGRGGGGEVGGVGGRRHFCGFRGGVEASVGGREWRGRRRRRVEEMESVGGVGPTVGADVEAREWNVGELVGLTPGVFRSSDSRPLVPYVGRAD